MLRTKYKVTEIFRTLQGEGWFSGCSAVMIRLAGCPLHCSFCDTDHTVKAEMDAAQIVSIVKDLYQDRDIVVITGGEPFFQDLEELLILLERFNQDLLDTGQVCSIIAVETNGVLYKQQTDVVKKLIDWVTVSPKQGHLLEATEAIKNADEVKVVFDGNISSVEQLIEDKLFEQGKCFIQPCSENFKPAVDFVLSHPKWRLSVQTQKVLGIR